MNALTTKKQLFMEELLRQKKGYIAEVGLREYQNLYWLVMGSPPYVNTWQELKGYLGELTPEGRKLMDEEQRDNNNMSDTPQTDQAEVSALEVGQWHLAKLCRQLERENAALQKDKEMLEIERCECLRTMSLALNNSAGMRELVNESYQFFRFGHKALKPWGKALDHWCERAEQLGFKKEAQP